MRLYARIPITVRPSKASIFRIEVFSLLYETMLTKAYLAFQLKPTQTFNPRGLLGLTKLARKRH
jgi:hypothetical protein